MTTPFPGDVIRARFEAHKMTQDEFAAHSKIHFVTLNRLLKGHDRINCQVALVLAKVFSTSPNYWLHLQADWDLDWHQKQLASSSASIWTKRQKVIERTGVME